MMKTPTAKASILAGTGIVFGVRTRSELAATERAYARLLP
jgi:hypothetical protein